MRETILFNPVNVSQIFARAQQAHQAGRLGEAEALYRQILAVAPEHAGAWHYLGVIAHQAGRNELAMKLIERSLGFDPRDAAAHSNLGEIQRTVGRLDEAVACFRRALELRPDYPEALLNFAAALNAQARDDEAVEACRRAVGLIPDSAVAWLNLGNALCAMREYDEAVNAYRRALAVEAGLAVAHYGLANALQGRGELEAAIVAYRRAVDLDPGNALFLSNPIYAMRFSPACDAAAMRKEQMRWNRLHFEPRRTSWRPHDNDRDPRRRLKIGYVSPDFYAHPVSFFLQPLFAAHDRAEVEVYCYSRVRCADNVTEVLRQSADVWRDARLLGEVQLAEQIRADGIDILVDLAMHTAGDLLQVFARRPAPVQVSWLAYAGSTGMEAIDYRFTDPVIDPPGEQESEPGGELVRLPDAWCCYAPLVFSPPVVPLPALQNGFVTFGALNQFPKVHEDLLRCWGRVLNAVPNSRLVMICPPGEARERVRAAFAGEGVGADRLELIAFGPWPEYVRLFERIDIALDTFPCNGMTTTCHALWIGVPVVTRAGASAVSRAGESLLHVVGMRDWVAHSDEEYVSIATSRARDLPRLAELRAALRPQLQASPLMDAPRFARHVENAFRMMWQRWCRTGQT